MRILQIIVFMCIGATLVACDKPDRSVRHYREIHFADKGAIPSAPMPTAGPMSSLPPEMQTPSLPLTWVTPDGWSETKGSGMRVVTFTVEGQECSILTFPGDVGGDEANIKRWLGQLGLNLPHETIHQFSVNPTLVQTDGGFECKLYDFADLIPDGSDKSILAGIIPVGEHTAFVKLMGDADILNNQKAVFKQLCRSIGMNENR